MPPLDVFLQPVRDGQAQVAIAAVLLLTLLDVFFGIVNALLHKEFRSDAMREGLGHKSVSFGAMVVAAIVDGTIMGGLDLGYPAPVLVAVCVYLALMEISSLLETWGKLWPAFADSPIYQLLDAAHVLDHKGETE